MTTGYGPRITTGGLEIYLDAGNLKSYPGSGSTWYDLVGNNNATLLSGASFETNNNAKYMSFDGTSNSYATIPYLFNSFTDTNFTWCVWVKGVATGNESMPRIGFGSGSWVRLGFCIRAGNWVFDQFDNSGPPNTSSVSIGPPDENNWLHLAAVANYDEGYIKTYRNGILHSSGSYVSANTNNAAYNLLGLGRAGTTGWPDGLFVGGISNFSIYNRSLTDSEILQNYKALQIRHI
jgi:hypothetical protein